MEQSALLDLFVHLMVLVRHMTLALVHLDTLDQHVQLTLAMELTLSQHLLVLDTELAHHQMFVHALPIIVEQIVRLRHAAE